MKITALLTSILFSVLFFTLSSVGISAPLEVFVSIPPQKWICDQLGGELIRTHILVDKGRDPHTFEPTPQQMTALTQAKLYFTLDLEFEEQILHKLEKSAPTLQTVDTADGLPTLTMSEHEHEEHQAHEEKGRHHGDRDPHVWLSPLNLKIMAATMTQALADHDPANKNIYAEKMQMVSQTLDQLHQQLSNELAPFHHKTFYVFHPAFGYFAHTYSLEQKAIETGGKSPSPKQLSTLISAAKQDGARVIFVQPQFDPKSAAAIATAIKGEVIPLDPLAEDVVSNLKIMGDRIAAAFAVR